jgi:hypothetical protein
MGKLSGSWLIEKKKNNRPRKQSSGQASTPRRPYPSIFLFALFAIFAVRFLAGF